MSTISGLINRLMDWSTTADVAVTHDMIDVVNERKETLLHWMCVYDRDDIICLLIDHGANVNRRDEVGGAPLHWAICNNNRYIATILLDNRASINARDDRGWTPLHYAASKGAYNMVKMLIGRGANTLAVDDDCCDAATIALHNGHRKVSTLIRGIHEPWG